VQSKKVDTVFEYMTKLFGAAPKCELVYKSDIDLLVAVMLSAQCTDRRVNAVTAKLFEKYKTVQDYANADETEFRREVYSTGFYRTKANNIIKMAKTVVSEHGGKIPADMDKLTRMAGVGRKTASVFLAEFHKIPAIAVDTHVIRISNRLGFTENKSPAAIERDLKAIFDSSNWAKYHLYMVLFGRYHCRAQNPDCSACKLHHCCVHYD